jgi:hypothetical protein
MADDYVFALISDATCAGIAKYTQASYIRPFTVASFAILFICTVHMSKLYIYCGYFIPKLRVPWD